MEQIRLPSYMYIVARWPVPAGLRLRRTPRRPEIWWYQLASSETSKVVLWVENLSSSKHHDSSRSTVDGGFVYCAIRMVIRMNSTRSVRTVERSLEKPDPQSVILEHVPRCGM